MYKYFLAVVLGSLLTTGCEKAEKNTSVTADTSTAAASSLQADVWPLPASTDNPVDTLISIHFDNAPVLGRGEIYIMDAADDSVADIIQVEGEVDFLGVDPKQLRTVKTRQVRIDGNRVVIQPHQGALAYGKQYYAVVPAEALAAASMNGKAFTGITKSSSWKFSVRDAAPATTSLVVSHNSKGDFYTLQGALNHVMQNTAVDEPVTIDLKNGFYEEILFLRGKNNLTLRGEDREKTVIQYLNNNTLSPGTGSSGLANEAQGGRSVFLIEEADMLTLENLTIKNTTLIGEGGQAETIYFNSPGRLIGKHINLFSEQDTLLVKGYNWFYDSLIAGNVDFIWGASRVSLFENCEIRTLGDSRGTGGGGYILQARSANPEDKGFVFLNSRLTRGEGPLGHDVPDHSAWLARSGGNEGYFDNIAFVNTRVDTHIHPGGWNPSRTANPANPHVHGGWRQYNIMNLAGELLDISDWQLGYTLTDAEYQAEFASRDILFSSWNNGAGWNPQP
ncbi:pectinesterase family protein [Cellvibrio polysaccharolyticus]|nr:pectinesterase family protein [Cellvibrio polysaccharolyticus]